MMAKSAELLSEWFWICDNCAAENFLRSTVLEMSAEDMEELREACGFEGESKSSIYGVPDSVTCRECGVKFATTMTGDAQNEE